MAKGPKKESKTVKAMKNLRNSKVWIAGFIVAAFILTSGIMLVGVGRGGGNNSKNGKNQQSSQKDSLKMRLEADIKFWSEKIEKNPKDSSAYLNLGEAYLKFGKTEKALENLKKATELEPDSILNLKFLARAYQAVNKPDEALKIYKKAVDKKPGKVDLSKLYGEMGIVYTSKKDYKNAEKYLNMALKNDPGEINNYYYLGSLYLRQKKKNMAKKVLADGLEIAKIANDRQKMMLLSLMLKEVDKPEKKVNKKKSVEEELKGGPIKTDERKFRKPQKSSKDN